MSRTPYPTDLTNAQWKLIAPHVPKPKPGGRPATYTRREVVNAILYQARNGCVWRALPHDLPPYRIVFHYFRLWQTDGTWDRIHDDAAPLPSVPGCLSSRNLPKFASNSSLGSALASCPEAFASGVVRLATTRGCRAWTRTGCRGAGLGAVL